MGFGVPFPFTSCSNAGFNKACLPFPNGDSQSNP